MRRAGSHFCAAALSLAATSVAAEAAASPQDIFSYGTRAPALGGTGAASAEGADATWANPALLSAARERELSIGFQAARLSLYARGNGLPGDMNADGLKGTLIGAVLPLPMGSFMKDRLALGLAFFTPTDVIVRGRVLYPDTPQFSLLADRLKSVMVQGGFGLDVGYGLRVGAGFSALAGIAGTVIVATDTSGNVGTKVDDQLIASYAKTLSASFDFLDDYRVGVTYRGALEARFAVRIEVYDLGALTVPPFNIAGIAQYDPWQVQGEIAKVKGPLRFAVGATFKRWSIYPGAPEATVLCPPERPDCQALTPAAAGFHDTIVPRVGVEAQVASGQGWKALGRAGYFYEPTPSPEQTTVDNGFDNSRHAFTLGAGLDMARPLPPLRLEAFGQLHALVARTHHKADDVPAGSAGAPEARTGGNVLMAGLAATVRF
jgi:long-subunit fatty acid transport protein